MYSSRIRVFLRAAILCAAVALSITGADSNASAADAPAPLLTKTHPVDWWFVYKFNASTFPKCGGTAKQSCPFGGKVQPYAFSQRFVYASSEAHALQDGSGCLGDTETDPVGATFDEIYNGHYSYVVWNDQFQGHPMKDQAKPWGHSKGIAVWNDDGEGLVMQVTTPAWPGSGSKDHPRQGDGNSLGCMLKDDVLVAQHFFAMKLNKGDLVSVLTALENASVVTNSEESELANFGGPPEVKALAMKLGTRSKSTRVIDATLSSGVRVISKPSLIDVPPWQMLTAVLDGTSVRAATWWAVPKIYTTKASTPVGCWDDSLGNQRGGVEIALTGQWNGKAIGLMGIPSNGNHAKIGVSTSESSHHYTIFSDLNQQGSIKAGQCASSQNDRGGLFFVLDDQDLWSSVSSLIEGKTAPTKAPPSP